MIDDILSYIAPHHCCGCGKIGGLLCGNCKYNIINESENACIVCHQPTSLLCLCNTCKMPYEKAWYVGRREDVLQQLIDVYKFKQARSAYRDLAELLSQTLPDLPKDTVIVPIPTISSHIRARGYDHMLLIAKHLARKRGLRCQSALYRKTNTKQRQASASQRIAQAEKTFGVRSVVKPDVPYLVLDDVYTTGATVKYASKVLLEAGAKCVWVAVIARQILD